MGFTTIAWYKSLAATGLTALSYITDSSMTPTGVGYVVPSGMNYLAAGYAMSAHAARGCFQSPSLRKLAYYYIAPADAAAAPSTATPWAENFIDPVPVTVNDELDAYLDNGGNSEASFVVGWLSSGPLAQVTGQIFTVEATGSTTTVAGAWTPVPLTFSTSLEFDQYDIVGLWAHFATGVAARVLIPGFPWRPGVIASSTANKMTPRAFRYGYLGVWATFAQTTPPQIECLSAGVTTSERFYLDLVKH
jgi:hypothetical protein